ncbi:MAG: SdiA-regulated domain-containing protein [Ginsengibacter sp.]
MQTRNLVIVLFFFAKFHSFEGCSANKNIINLPCKEYDLNNPYILRLGDALSEISGISFYTKDSSVFAINDESGYLYKIHFNKKFLVENWKFDKQHDFEDVLLHDSSFYILESNGNIETLNFSVNGDTIFNRKSVFPSQDKSRNEFESLYYNEENNGLVIVCKDCENDKKNAVSAWDFDPAADTYTPSGFSINVKPVAKITGEDKLKLKPSATAVNPITKDIWILSSDNQLLVVTDREGNTREVYTLNPVIFNQPEGITFTPWGDLLISNEAGDKYGTATLLIFKPKIKG